MLMDPFKGVLCVDIETSSLCDIKQGSWAYSLHRTTIVYCVSFGYAEGPERFYVHTWEPGDELEQVEELVGFIRAGGRLLAHNAGFEKSIWTNILAPAYGFPMFEPGQWADTQTLGLAINMPFALEGLCKALGTPIKKDEEGNKLMKAMAKPKVDKKTGAIEYDQDPLHVARLIEYCELDVRATLSAYFRLPPLSVDEKLVAAVDERINERGVYLDQVFAGQCLDVVDRRAHELANETFEATGAWLANATSTPALKKWLKDRGVKLPMVARKTKKGMTKSETADRNTVLKLLEDRELPADVRAVLDNRVEANKATSLAKLKRVKTMVGGDGRLRYALQYCGAHTGRWTSSGLQVHNLPKNRMEPGESALVHEVLTQGSLEGLKMAVDRPLDAVSQSLRSVIAAPPGRELIAADYSAIEARVIAWLAGQGDVLALFEEGRDVYVDAAHKAGSTNRQLGKVCVLALGYGMGALKFVGTAAGWGIVLSLKEGRAIQKAWREGNPYIVQFWRELEDAARDAIENPGRQFRVGSFLTALVHKNVLLLRLPSGRCIRYMRPKIVPTIKKIKTVDDDGNVVEREMHTNEIRFWTMGKDKKRMERESTYGGKLAENVTQAVSRDLLAAALVRIDPVEPYDLVMHVHDSIAAEVPAGGGNVQEFCYLMEERPKWARGLPIAVEGYRDLRFRG